MTPRWKQSPPDSHWGEFGPDDRLGRMNLVTPAKVRQGIAEVREGLTFCLSLPLDVPGGMALNARRLPPRLYGTLRDGASAGVQGFCWSYSTEDPNLTDVVCDEVMLMNTQYSTQWDSLAHIGSRFDADGDGKVDFGEFQNMIKVSRKAAIFLTGNEKLERLTDEQMTAFLLFEGWPNKHVGPGVYERQSHKHGGHAKKARDTVACKQ